MTGFQVLPYIATRHRVIIEKLRALSCHIGWDRVIVPTIVLHSDPNNRFNSTTELVDDNNMKMLMFINTSRIFEDKGIVILDIWNENNPIRLNLFEDINEFRNIGLWNHLCYQLFESIKMAVRIDTQAHLFNIGYVRQELDHQLLYLAYHNFQPGTKLSPANSIPIPERLDQVDPSSIEAYMRIIRQLILYISRYGVYNRNGLTDDVVDNVTRSIEVMIN